MGSESYAFAVNRTHRHDGNAFTQHPDVRDSRLTAGKHSTCRVVRLPRAQEGPRSGNMVGDWRHC